MGLSLNAVISWQSTIAHALDTSAMRLWRQIALQHGLWDKCERQTDGQIVYGGGRGSSCSQPEAGCLATTTLKTVGPTSMDERQMRFIQIGFCVK